jgi:hypothetical protein
MFLWYPFSLCKTIANEAQDWKIVCDYNKDGVSQKSEYFIYSIVIYLTTLSRVSDHEAKYNQMPVPDELKRVGKKAFGS